MHLSLSLCLDKRVMSGSRVNEESPGSDVPVLELLMPLTDR